MGKRKSREDLRRKSPDRESRDCILIVCEGEDTEINYFNFLKEKFSKKTPTVKVKVADSRKKTDCLSVVNKAIKDKKAAIRSTTQDNYDFVWCVFDIDVPVQEKLTESITLANENEIKLALSNPCFEYWYILHYCYTKKPFQKSDDVEADLKCHNENYTKSSKVICSDLFDKTDTAIGNAKRVNNSNSTDIYIMQNNPSTNVYKLVEFLRDKL